MALTSVEICAGAGGQALGLEQAGFDHLALVENDIHACATLRQNRPYWNTVFADVHGFDIGPYRTSTRGDTVRPLDLLAGGVPCPPFSMAGKQLGPSDDRDLFPAIIRLAAQAEPNAVLVECSRAP